MTVGLLDGKRLLITGVITDQSIAFSVAGWRRNRGRRSSSPGSGGLRSSSAWPRSCRSRPRSSSSTSRLTSSWPGWPTRCASTSTVWTACCTRSGRPGVLPRRGFLDAPWTDVATAVQCRRYSFKSLAVAALPLIGEAGGSIVGLTFDATVAWPAYDWMGVAKAGLESASRYLARELGPRKIRVNLIAAGPIRTMAAKSIPGFSAFEERVGTAGPRSAGQLRRRARRPHRGRTALGLDAATTGEIVHVDGGFHAMGV